jgi:TATA-binding protein-associated factor Taf7
VRKALIRFVGPDMRSEIQENQGVGQEDLLGELNRQRLDMTLERRSYEQRQGEEEKEQDQDQEQKKEREKEKEKEEENKEPSKFSNSRAHMVAFHTEGTHWRKFTRRKRRSMKNLQGN